ncbi:hypothetical protein [Capnocytophaga leadbetteri]
MQPVANAIRIDVREGKIISIKIRIAIDQIFEIFEKLFPGYAVEEDPTDPNYAKCIIVLSDYFLWRTPEASYCWDINHQETLLNTLTITAK